MQFAIGQGVEMCYAIKKGAAEWDDLSYDTQSFIRCMHILFIIICMIIWSGLLGIGASTLASTTNVTNTTNATGNSHSAVPQWLLYVAIGGYIDWIIMVAIRFCIYKKNSDSEDIEFGKW